MARHAPLHHLFWGSNPLLLLEVLLSGVAQNAMRWLLGIGLKILSEDVSGVKPELMPYLQFIFLEGITFGELAGLYLACAAVESLSRSLINAGSGAEAVSRSTAIETKILNRFLDEGKPFPHNQEQTVLQQLSAFRQYLSYTYYFRCISKVYLAVSVVTMLMIAWDQALVTFGVLFGVLVLAPALQALLVSGPGRVVRTKSEAILQRFSDILRLRDTVMVSNMQAQEEEGFQRLNTAAQPHIKHLQHRKVFAALPINILQTTIPLAMLSYVYWTADKASNGVPGSVAEFYRALAVIIIGTGAFENLNVLTWLQPQADEFEVVLNELRTLCEDDTIEEARNIRKASGRWESRRNPAAKAEDTVIGLDTVTIGYPTSPQHKGGLTLLSGENLIVREQQRVALLGQTGIGKSSFLRSLMGLNPVLGGHLFVSGKDISRRGTVAGWRESVFYMPQQTRLFRRSLRENLLYGLGHHSDADIMAAARRAQLDEWIEGLPHRLDTLLLTGEATLSGGQMQRVQLARLFLSNKPVVLLDEPTAALDPETEERLIEDLADFLQSRTAIIVTHRVSLIPLCQSSYLIQAGQLIDVSKRRASALEQTLETPIRDEPVLDRSGGDGSGVEPLPVGTAFDEPPIGMSTNPGLAGPRTIAFV